MPLRASRVLSAAFPAGLALALYYLAANTDGPDADILFRSALSLTIAAAMWTRIVWLHHLREEDNAHHEDQQEMLTRRVRALERENADLRTEVDARLAVRAWRQAAGGHVRLVIPNQSREN